MQKIFKANSHVYNRDHINTDEIIPARRMTNPDEAHLAQFAMEDLDPDFVNKVQAGDFIIAGENFGCGSSREHAIWALRGAGVKCVIAKSFARIFFRNAVNNGFLAITASVEANNGDIIEIDTENGKIRNITQDKEFDFSPIPDFVLEIEEKGGLLNTL
ncbi:MAG: 3-isopropylmalate dehydratase [Candidatus Gracilibacteria bacterium]|jgi:3-isopropylmalate/(R)-2-methylmalate dehydratase small subunit|nr:3-isopropylmalate dehydratase [Candidatus Gracilibacteria bacterium]